MSIISRCLLASFVFLLTSLNQVDACSVPVFRYALEQWEPDAYRLVVIYENEISPQLTEQIGKWKEVFEKEHANIHVSTLDVHGEIPPQDKWLLDNPEITEYPAFMLINPGGGTYPPQLVSTGSIADLEAETLVSSAVRDQITDQLVGGASAVWVFLECGIPEKDDASFEVLKKELAHHQNELKLPEIDSDDLEELKARPEDIRIDFQLLRLSRDDPQEQVLVNLLLASEPDLRELTYLTEPMAFPIFGRGRVLYTLIGAGIQPLTIEEASRFLVGECQCTVKADNPGVDLLLSRNWSEAIQVTEPEEVEIELTGVAGFQGDALAANDEMVSKMEPDPVSTDVSSAPQSEAQTVEIIDVESTSENERAAVQKENRVTGTTFGVWALLGMIAGVVCIASLGVMFRS
ncbi:hypothetical protein KOR42_43710 [Thalassoglobus neptunius]|uniref:Thioredoxin domain-containing protein n=1 Tax=Thalassoglobus neptunius TaxID=1938619 RepID=A0A5C5W9M5_9PLAN|nr:hypothetical protein [Thalassoglobus neptunius]TWT46332.1 hypothetical protein KOR42_43710 [Thalassoglobus neptunius]